MADVQADDQVASTTPKKKKTKRFWITLAVVVVVIAGGGAGFWVWHNTPSFCDAICHNPQDPYNPTYYAEVGQAATDKWGNEVSDAAAMMSALHRDKIDANCLTCHQPTLEEQITEGIEWLTGNFYNPLSERSLTDLMRWTEGATGEEFCMNENCHNYSLSTLTLVTSNYERNPHSWHHSEYTCSDCHKGHRASIMVCAECHEDSVVPSGWITPVEARALETIYGSYADEVAE